MSFKSPNWDNNVLADETCTDLFHKKQNPSKNKLKTKQKKNLKTQKNNIGPSKTETKEPIPRVIQARKMKQKTKRSTKFSKGVSKINTISISKSNIVKRSSKDNIIHNEQVSLKIKKKLKRLENKKESIEVNSENVKVEAKINKSTGLNIANLKKQLAVSLEAGQIKQVHSNSLRERMTDKLKAARFRYLNEQIYTSEGKEALKMFQSDPDAFEAYHQGYRQQVLKWPLNPLDTIITAIKKMPTDHIVADFGCGDAKLSRSVQQKVHSFDLVATNKDVIACDMSRVPIRNNSADVVVFCLSLMGTNLKDYLLEANRILKIGGVVKIAEVESRFESVDNFIQGLQKFGFKHTWKDLSHNLFYFLDFIKERDIKYKNKLPSVSLQPCLYKKR